MKKRKLNQEQAPLFETLLRHSQKKVSSFHTPGHKNGKGIDPLFKQIVAEDFFSLDVTVFPEVDSLHDPRGCIKEAQELASQLYGVKNSFFLVNGSTCGNQAMLLSTCKPKETLIFSRNIHRSVLSGIILSGIWPIWLPPQIDQELDIIMNASSGQIEKALQDFPEAKGVFVTTPTYNGVITDIKEIQKKVKEKGKILLVDEAHGPHLKFHPTLHQYSAVEAGADLVVESIHKILSALSQGSILNYNSEIIDINRVSKIVSFLQTTSPSYPILASIDLARRQIALQGVELIDKIIKYSEKIKKEINSLNNIFCLTEDNLSSGYHLDPSKITINVTRTGLSGYEIEEILNEEYKVQVDCADLFNLVAIMGVGTDEDDVNRLINALKDIDKKYHGESTNWKLQIPSLASEMVLNPREVILSASSREIPISESKEYISAQILCPYPPGIPILLPGERITQEIIDYIQDLKNRGIRITGQEGENLDNIKIVEV